MSDDLSAFVHGLAHRSSNVDLHRRSSLHYSRLAHFEWLMHAISILSEKLIISLERGKVKSTVTHIVSTSLVHSRIKENEIVL